MAHGDVGGSITELVITCVTPRRGAVSIEKGDPVSLVTGGAYEIDSSHKTIGPLFGQALVDATENDVAIPIKVRGICIFPYSGDAPSVNGVSGVRPSTEPGKVEGACLPHRKNINLKVDITAQEVHVLI